MYIRYIISSRVIARGESRGKISPPVLDFMATSWPRILIVARRSTRNNKLIDFVGEYHLDLLVKSGAVPVIVPRVPGIEDMLPGFEPFHGVLLCEGEDVDPARYLPGEEADDNRRPAADASRDSIELRLARLCLEKNIPLLGICRGCHILNVAAGGTLYQDLERETGRGVAHLDYGNYDGLRHGVSVVENTPLHSWFAEEKEEDEERVIMVNSYHHQGVKKLAGRFLAMGFAGDWLVEAFYDPDEYDPDGGKFLVGLQFHPERLRDAISEEFDYPGCPRIYQEFVRAAAGYLRKSSPTTLE